jgi:hypothetical protein
MRERVAHGLLFALCGALIAPSAASAQLLKYENKAEVAGAALVSPESTRRILRILQDACNEAHPGAEAQLAKENAAWEKRHSRYLQLSQRARNMLGHKAQQETYELLERVPAEMAKGIVFVIHSTKASGPKAVDSFCASLAQSLADGKWDLQNNDPTLTAYFDDLIQREAGVPASANPALLP